MSEITRHVKWVGKFAGQDTYKSVEKFNGRKYWYVLQPDEYGVDTFYTTNNRDWEPEYKVSKKVTIEVIE